MLTEADDYMRALDIPERMQIASVGLHLNVDQEGLPTAYVPLEELPKAAQWMSDKISPRCTQTFLLANSGVLPPLHEAFLDAVIKVLGYLNVDFLEVPFIYANRSDTLIHVDYQSQEGLDSPQLLLNEDELWKLSALSLKYRALSYRKKELETLFNSLEVYDDDEVEYFMDLFQELSSVEEVADTHQWLALKYTTKLRDLKAKEAALNEDVDDPLIAARFKRAKKEDWYDLAKNNFVSQLAKVS